MLWGKCCFRKYFTNAFPLYRQGADTEKLPTFGSQLVEFTSLGEYLSLYAYSLVVSNFIDEHKQDLVSWALYLQYQTFLGSSSLFLNQHGHCNHGWTIHIVFLRLISLLDNHYTNLFDKSGTIDHLLEISFTPTVVVPWKFENSQHSFFICYHICSFNAK